MIRSNGAVYLSLPFSGPTFLPKLVQPLLCEMLVLSGL